MFLGLPFSGVSQSEPWSSHPADQTTPEEGLVTTETRPGSPPSEGEGAEATLQFDSIASTLAAAAAAVSHTHDATEGVTKDQDQLPTVLGTARESERPEQLLEAATAGHQRDAPFTSKPLAGLSALPGSPKPESSSLPKHPAKFLPREEQAGNSTAQEFMNMERSTPVPRETSVVEPFSSLTVSSVSLESAGPQVTLSASLWPATVAGDLHAFTLMKNTEAEEPGGQTMRTSAKGSLGARLTIVPESSPHTQGRSQPAVGTDSGRPDVFRTAGHLARPQSPFATLRFSATSWPTLSEQPVTIISRTEMSSLSSYQHGETKEHHLAEHGKTESPTPLAPSQSTTHSFPLRSSPGTPSPPAVSEDVGQSSLSRLVLPSQVPTSSQPAAPTQLETCMNLTLHHGMGHQTAAQAAHFRLPQTAALLEGRLPVSQTQEATMVVSVPADSKPQPSAAVRGQPQARVPSRTPTADSASSRVRPAMPALAASSKVWSPSLAASAATPSGEMSRFRSRFQLPPTPPSVNGEHPLPSTVVPEPAANSSAPAPAKQQTPDIPSGLKRLAGPPPPPHAGPGLVSALAQTQAPSPGRPAAQHAELSTSAVMDSAPSRLRTPALPASAGGELRERVLGLPASFQAEQGMLGNSASTPARPTAPGASSPCLEPGGAAAPVVARLSVSGAPHPRPTPSADVRAETRSLLAEVSAEPTPPAVPAVSFPSMNVPSRAKPQVPGGAASFTKESHLLATSVPTRAEPEMDEAAAESRFAASTPAPQRTGTSLSAHASVPLLVFSAPAEHPLLGVSAKPGTQLRSVTQAPKASSSLPNHTQLAGVASHGQLKPEPPSTSLDTSLQPPHTPTSASPGTQTMTLPTYARPGLRRPATAPDLPAGGPHSPVKESEGSPSPQPIPLTSHTGMHKATGLAVSPLPLGRSPPRPDSPASQVSRGNEVNPPLVSGALVEGSVPGLRTTPDVQDLMYSSLGFIQPLNRSDAPAARSLDPLAAGEYLGMPPSLHHLSVLVRNAENMVCFQSLQDATAPPSGAPNASGRGAASAQEMLLLSSSLGFTHLGAPSLAQSMSPPGAVLVKPVLVFLPVDKPDVPVRSSAEEEKGAPHASLLFPSKGLAPLGGSQEQPKEARPTLPAIRNPAKENTLSANSRLSEEPVISGPALQASLWSIAEAGWVRSSSVMTVPSHSALAELSTRAVSFKNKDQGGGFPSPALNSQEKEENHPVLLPVGASAAHQVSIPPSVQVVASLQQGPKLLPTLHSLTEPPAPQGGTSSLLTSRTTGRPQQGLRPALVLQSPPQGFVTPLTSLGKDREGPSSASTAGNMELPLEMEPQFTPSKSANASWVEKQPVPSVASDVLVLSSEQKHQVSGALNYSHSGAVLDFPVATEMASYPAKATSSRPFLRHTKTSLAKEDLTPLPLFTLPSTDSRIKTTRGTLEDVMSHQTLSRSPADVPLPLPVSSYFAKSAPKHNPTTLVTSGRASLADREDRMEPTANAGETHKSVRVTDVRHPAGATDLTPAMFGRDSGPPSTLIVVAELHSAAEPSSDPRQAGDAQRGVTMLSPAPASLLASNPAHKDLARSPTAGEMPLLERVSGSLSRPGPTASGASKEQDSPLRQRGGEHDAPVPTNRHPQPISPDGAHLERPRLLEDDQAQKAHSSLQEPGGTPTSVVSIVLSASTFPGTTSPSGAGGAGWVSNQTSDLQSPSLNTPETPLSFHTQIQPTLELLSDASEATAEPDMLGDVTGEYDKSRSYVMGEKITGRKDATAGAEGLVASQNGEAPHRRLLRSEDVFLDG